MMIQQNISAPCTVLDFPTRESFQVELAAGDYKIVGISSIVINVGKVREMCRIVRRIAPDAVVVVGGHVTALADIEFTADADRLLAVLRELDRSAVEIRDEMLKRVHTFLDRGQAQDGLTWLSYELPLRTRRGTLK